MASKDLYDINLDIEMLKKSIKMEQYVDDLDKAIKSLSTEEKLERILFLLAMIHNSIYPENMH